MSPLRAVVPGNPMVRLLLIVVGATLLASAVAGVITGSIIRSSIDANSAAQRHKLFSAQVAGCQRQNVRQGASNRNALATFNFDEFFAQALVRPQARQTRARRRLTAMFRARLLDTVASLTWTPLNADCSREPTAVQLPVAFSRRLPRASDLR